MVNYFLFKNWAFLARFCFLSEQGTFEFYFEFKNDQGYPNLLLYYDAPDQWQSIYKTDKVSAIFITFMI